ncbi:hypothetical protein [Candidimonas sp. SYP-B2681]|uniref:hypothetical protein n=1 Tax=Candidimonas sp. SYP-B2681 TaxID=2497686 RepID=UPI0018F62594|nr:hypothetical protein [Candidimonas sp. SYP-B2681]
MTRIALIVLLSGLLLACTPSYNWREISVAGGAVHAFFPDRPITQERPLNFSGHEIRFGLTTASVDDVVFAVAYAPLPEALRSDPAKAQEFVSAVVTSLYRNVGATVPAKLPESGEAFAIDGRSGQSDIRMRARVWLTSHALVEAIVTADQATFPQAEADEFLSGIQVAR